MHLLIIFNIVDPESLVLFVCICAHTPMQYSASGNWTFAFVFIRPSFSLVCFILAPGEPLPLIYSSSLNLCAWFGDPTDLKE